MKDDGSSSPLGGAGKVVEVDKTYMPTRSRDDDAPATFVNGKGWQGRRGPKPDALKVVTLVERARSIKVEHLTAVNQSFANMLTLLVPS